MKNLTVVCRDYDNPRDNQIRVRLNDDELIAIDRMAEKVGKTRAALMREILLVKAYDLITDEFSNIAI